MIWLNEDRAYATYSEFAMANPRPRYKAEQLDHFEALNAALTAHGLKKHRQGYLENRLEQLREHLVTCPKCSHDFFLDPDVFDAVEKELAELVVPAKPDEESPIDNPQIQLECRFIKAWLGAPDAAANPGYTRQELAEQTRLNELLPQRRGWETKLHDLQANLPEEISEGLIQELSIWERKYAVRRFAEELPTGPGMARQKREVHGVRQSRSRLAEPLRARRA